MDNPLVSISTVNFNGRVHLRECLESLLSQTYPNIEIILVDNASGDGSAEFVAETFPSVKLVRSEANLGHPGGHNLGRPHCRGEYVIFLNNDTRVDRDAVSALMRARNGHPEFSVFMALSLDYTDHSKVDSAGDTFYWMGFPFSFEGYPAAMFDRPRRVAMANTTMAMFPKKLLDQIGWWDAQIFLNFEDSDLSLRARHAGADILFVPEARVYHKRGSTIGKKSALNTYYSERNLQLVVLKNFPASVLIRFLPGFLLIKAARLYFEFKDGDFWACLRGNLASLKQIPRVLAERRRILKSSRLSPKVLASLFRENWSAERRAFKRGIYDVPI